MGYRIDYGTGRRRRRALPMLFFGCCCTLLGVCLVPQGRQVVWGMLTGGDGERMRAVSTMLYRVLSEGKTVAVSALAICREAVAGLG